MLYTDNRQNKIDVTDEFIKEIEEVCVYALEKEEVRQKCQISLLFVNNEEIREINKETRNIDKVT
ncbi:rRNA maturation RNAse YbeY, partial [Clostridium saudiense]|nr:rRNA maturation RNAse YbeY [Clostridium saudiense]